MFEQKMLFYKLFSSFKIMGAISLVWFGLLYSYSLLVTKRLYIDIDLDKQYR